MVNTRNKNTGYCKLCGEYKTLALSHIYPKFIMKWLKETGTGFLRAGSNLNLRVQDGLKIYLLCAACENHFGKLETYFSSSIFYPIVNNEDNAFHYDERLFKFVISIFWRLLHHSILEDEKGYLSYSHLLSAENKWREYLLHNRQLDSFDKLHLLIGVDVTRHSSNPEVEAPNRLISYMARYIDSGVTDNNKDYCIAFLKLPRFFFLIPIAGFDDNQMINTEIFLSGGFYKANDAIIEDPTIGWLLLDRVKQFEVALEQVSPYQRQKMRDMGRQKWDDFKSKDLGQILEYANNRGKKT